MPFFWLNLSILPNNPFFLLNIEIAFFSATNAANLYQKMARKLLFLKELQIYQKNENYILSITNGNFCPIT